MSCRLIRLLLVGFVCCMICPPAALAGVISTTGDFEVIDVAPPSVRRQVYESDDAIRVFLERELVVGTIPVNAVSPGVYDAYADFVDQDLVVNGPIRSYLIHFDPVGQPSIRLNGSVTFAEPILAVIGRSLTMAQTDATLGAPGTLYPTPRFNRELEYRTRGSYDFFRLEDDGHTLWTQLLVGTDVDQIRVITAVPEPAGSLLVVASYLLLLHRRQWR